MVGEMGRVSIRPISCLSILLSRNIREESRNRLGTILTYEHIPGTLPSMLPGSKTQISPTVLLTT